jgi:hypothetical protein
MKNENLEQLAAAARAAKEYERKRAEQIARERAAMYDEPLFQDAQRTQRSQRMLEDRIPAREQLPVRREVPGWQKPIAKWGVGIALSAGLLYAGASGWGKKSEASEGDNRQRSGLVYGGEDSASYNGSSWLKENGVNVEELLQQTNPGEHPVVGAPSIDADVVQGELEKYNSPALDAGGDIWIELGKRYGIDPAFALAFFIHESSAGTNGAWAGLKPGGETTHNIGNIICAGYDRCYGRFRDYRSWEEGIEDWYKLIADEYIKGRNIWTVEQIIPVYAPSSDNNNVPGYIGVVDTLTSEYRERMDQKK